MSLFTHFDYCAHNVQKNTLKPFQEFYVCGKASFMNIFLGVLALVFAAIGTVLQILDSIKNGEKVGTIKVGRIVITIVLLLVGIILLLIKESPKEILRYVPHDTGYVRVDTVSVPGKTPPIVQPRLRPRIEILPTPQGNNPSASNTADGKINFKLAYFNNGEVSATEFHRIYNLFRLRGDTYTWFDSYLDLKLDSRDLPVTKNLTGLLDDFGWPNAGLLSTDTILLSATFCYKDNLHRIDTTITRIFRWIYKDFENGAFIGSDEQYDRIKKRLLKEKKWHDKYF